MTKPPSRWHRVDPGSPVVVHRHGDRSRQRSVAVIVAGPFDAQDELDAALSLWRKRIGGWVTKQEAAERLNVTTQRVDQLRAEGVLKSDLIGGLVAIDLDSLNDELNRRADDA